MSPHQVSPGHGTNRRAGRFYTQPIHLSEKRFKKWAGFLPNAPKKKFGLRIARYFYRCPIFPLPARFVPVMKKTENNHGTLSMKFQLGVDRRAENNLPSTEMPFGMDVAQD